MNTQKFKRVCAGAMAGALAAVTVLAAVPGEVLAAKKTGLKTKKISVAVGKKKKISIQGKKAKHKYTFVSKNKKVAKVSAKGIVTGVKVGKTKITVKDSYTQKNKKRTKVLGTVTVTVKGVTKKTEQTAAPTSIPTATAPIQSVPSAATPPAGGTASQVPTAPPATTASPEPTPVEISNLWPDEEFDPNSTAMPDTPATYQRKFDNVQYGEMREITYHSETTTKDRKANVLLPVNYSEDNKYPVLYLLHGLDGDHNEWKNSGKPDFIIGNLVSEGLAKDMIVVMPNARARANDAGGPSDSHSVEHFAAFDNFKNDLINDLMPYMKENFSIAEGRENTAIAGLSMGGRTALYIGISMPETFGYVGAFSPAPGVLPYTTEDGLFNPKETFKLPDEYNGKNFVMICTADDDKVVYENPVQYAQTLQENGTERFFYMRKGGGHGWDVWKSGLYHFAKRIFTKLG